MKFKCSLNVERGLSAIDIIALVNVFFLLLVFLAASFFMTSPTSIDIQFPKNLTSDVNREGNVVVITSENVIYLNNKITSVKDLSVQLSQSTSTNVPLLIKADRRASVGRIVDVWDLCRALGIERINIATNRE